MEISTKEEIVEAIGKLNVLDLAELVKELEKKFGIKAAAPFSSAPGQPAETSAAPTEKTEWTVVLSAIGDQKIPVIKEVRSITGLGLKEAKDLVEGAPKTLKEKVSKEEAEKIKQQIEKVGGKVELK